MGSLNGYCVIVDTIIMLCSLLLYIWIDGLMFPLHSIIFEWNGYGHICYEWVMLLLKVLNQELWFHDERLMSKVRHKQTNFFLCFYILLNVMEYDTMIWLYGCIYYGIWIECQCDALNLERIRTRSESRFGGHYTKDYNKIIILLIA